MHRQKQTLGGSIYSGLQKGLHAGQKAVEYTALAKGVYEAGQTLFSIGRAVAPMAAALLIIKCGSQANRLGTLGGRQEDS